jgi:phage-related protein
MKTLTAALVVEKNKLLSDAPFITLLILEIDSDTNLYLAVYPEDVLFPASTNGDTYTAFPAIVSSISESSQGQVQGLAITVGNANRLISSYIENNKILGNNVTIRVVHADQLDDSSNKVDFTYRINRIHVTAEVAVFELGHENLLALQLPRQRFIRDRCRFVYKDAQCEYPGDSFSNTTQQDFTDDRTTGDPFEKLNGWYVLNPTAATACDTSITYQDHLTISNKSDTTGRYAWIDDETDGIFVYKEIEGNFDAETKFFHTAIDTPNVGVLFMVGSEPSTAIDITNWLGFRWRCIEDTANSNEFAAVDNIVDTGGTTTTIIEDTSGYLWHQYVRITRNADVFTLYSKSALADSWTEQYSVTRTDMSSTLRIGFASTVEDSAPPTSLYFEYLTFNSGGLANCDYTLNAGTGCVTHKNSLNFGGFPAIPYGRLSGI